ncbi:MAG: AAA family ATPase [candidate division Zixibacteria bacterium]|nr:AAA family ATPase [candidate division Zixibacteria bacterium]
MRIDKINVNNFGKFSDYAASFGSGINIIKGANESGKSTLVEAIIAALYTDAKSNKKSIKDRVKWGTNGSKIDVSLSTDAGQFNLNKDFFSGAQLLEDGESETRTETKEGWEKFLESKLGISDEIIFNATACVRQDEIDKISQSSEKLRERLEGIITGGQEEVVAGKVIEDLNKRINEIKKEGSKHPGILQGLDQEYKDLEYEIENLSRELEAAEARRGELAEVASRLEEINAEYSEKSVEFEKLDKAHNARIAKNELEEKHRDLKTRYDELNLSQEKVVAYRKELSGKSEIDSSDISKVEELESKVRYLEGKLIDSENDEKILVSSLRDTGGVGLFLGLNVFNFILIIACAAAGLIYEPIIAAGSGLFVLTQVVFIVLLWRRSAERAALRSQIKFLSKRIQEVKNEVDTSKTTIREILGKYKLGSAAELRQTQAAYVDIQRKINEEAARYESLLGGKNQKVLKQQLEAISADLQSAQQIAGESGDIPVDPARLEVLKQEVSDLSAEKIKFEEKKSLLTKQLELNESGGEQLSALQERLEHNRLMHERYSKRLNVYRVTASLIETARTNILKATAELLENKVSKYLSDITGGKYDKIKFDRSTLDFTVFSPEKQDWVESKDLFSKGVIDQIYLCARLALIDIVAGDSKPFIILDDPFVHFDPDRTQNALKVLKEMSSDFQILLFTSNNNYDSAADNVIQL